MREHGRPRASWFLTGLGLLALAGCTAFPWTKPDSLHPRPADPRAEEKVPGHPDGKPKPPSLGSTEVDPIVTAMHSVNESTHAQLAVLTQQLANAGDDNKVLSARVQYLEGELRSRDENLQLAGNEIKEATDELLRTRSEIQRWKRDFQNLRGKLGTMEKENADVVDSIIRALEKTLNQQRLSGKSGETPEQLPLPRLP